jgi:threonine efflux protein
MNYADNLVVLAGVLALSMISPGPNFAIVTSTAIAQSRRAGVIAGLGLAAASGTWTLLTLAGLGLVIAHAAWLYAALRVLGASYLIFLGARMLWHAAKPLPLDADQPARNRDNAFRKAYFVSLTNPKSAAFYGSILAVMLPAHAPLWFSAAVVGLAVLLSAIWYCGVAYLLSSPSVRRRFLKVRALFDAMIGVVLMGLGVKLLAGP